MRERYEDGVLRERIDETGVTTWDERGTETGTRPLAEDEQREVAVYAHRRESLNAATAHRDALDGARELLRDYGTPKGLGFAQTYSAVQTAVLEYRDSGITDPVCEEHRNWMTARVSEITAAALYAAGVLK